MKAGAGLALVSGMAGIGCAAAGLAGSAPGAAAPVGAALRASTVAVVKTGNLPARPVALPPGVIPASAILARYSSARPGVTTGAKLVSLAQLAVVSKGELTQCAFRGCPSGAYVWLVLQDGPPGTFTFSTAPGAHLPSGAGAWSLFPVNATTGVARGDVEIGVAGRLGTSPWGQLTALATAG